MGEMDEIQEEMAIDRFNILGFKVGLMFEFTGLRENLRRRWSDGLDFTFLRAAVF
jgi:hypothetical protein